MHKKAFLGRADYSNSGIPPIAGEDDPYIQVSTMAGNPRSGLGRIRFDGRLRSRSCWGCVPAGGGFHQHNLLARGLTFEDCVDPGQLALRF